MQKHSEETLTQVVNSAAMGIWTIEYFENEKPRAVVTDKMLELMGVSPSVSMKPEEVYDYWYSHIHPEALASVQKSFSKMMSGILDENTYKWNHPVLGVRYVRCGGTATRILGKGFRLQGYHYDVTNQIIQNEEKDSIINSLVSTYMCLYYLDLRKGTYVAYNNTLSYVRDAVPEQGWISVGFNTFANQLVKPEYFQQVQKFCDLSTLDERMRFKNRISCRFLGAHDIWSKATIIACTRDERGNPVKAIFGVRNIDKQVVEERRHAEELQQSLDSAKSNTEYMQNLTHEIRTPLNAMYGFAQLLALPDGCLSSTERQEYFKHINNSFNMLSMLIDDVLDLADVAHGNYHTVMGTVDVNTICRSAIDMAIIRKQAEVNMVFTSDVDDSYTIQSDARRIQQLLVNYLTNACKHTMHGEIHLHVSTTEVPDHLTFSVTDTGEGIPAEQAENIFERFKKLNQSVQGHGLGLNICSIIAQNLGGTVKLDTTYTNGARFLFIL